MVSEQDNQTSQGATPTVSDPSALPQPAQHALAAYRATFAMAAGAGRIVVAWAPGRVNLIGEHTDYSQGLVLPAAVDRVVAFAGQAADDARVELFSVHDDQTASFAVDADALRAELPSDLPRWARYVRAVLAELASLPNAPDVPGFGAAIAGNVPVGGGMSSSAALLVAAATFATALGVASLGPMEMAQLCQRAEERATGVRVGIMDQAASYLGRAGYALLLDCRTLAYEYVPARLGTVTLVVFDTGVPRTLAQSGYNTRRSETEQAVATLAPMVRADLPERQITSARDVTSADLERFGSALPDMLFRRLRHTVTENQRVEAAAAALRANDLVQLGRLMVASHESLRDDYEVSCEELDGAVEIALTVPGVVGARLMGAGFGGSALFLVEQEALDRLARVLAQEYPKFAKTSGTLHVCQIASGPQARTLAS